MLKCLAKGKRNQKGKKRPLGLNDILRKYGDEGICIFLPFKFPKIGVTKKLRDPNDRSIALGVFVWAIAVFLMVEGNILGERTTGIATMLGMVGMFIILITCMHALMSGKAKKSSKET